MKVEHIVCQSGDWVVLRLNGREFYSGHSVPDFVWMDLITNLSGKTVTTSCKEVSDDEMLEGDY